MVELLESSRHDAVMTVMDAVSKRVHFIPMHTMVTAERAAKLFLHYIWKLHGLLKRVVSDRGFQFVASFTKELYRLLGIQISSSMAWHLQQTDRRSTSTRSLTSSSTYSSTNNRTTGTTYYQLRSFSTTTTFTPRHNNLRSYWTRDESLA